MEIKRPRLAFSLQKKQATHRTVVGDFHWDSKHLSDKHLFPVVTILAGENHHARFLHPHAFGWI